MSADQVRPGLALIVCGPPYRNRVARADIDLALAAAALDFELHVCFMGCSILQLAVDGETTDAMLPVGRRAWAALPDLGQSRVYAEQQWIDYCTDKGVKLLIQPEAPGSAGMRRAWRHCQHVIVV